MVLSFSPMSQNTWVEVLILKYGWVHMNAKELRVDHHTDWWWKPGGEDIKRLKKSEEKYILPKFQGNKNLWFLKTWKTTWAPNPNQQEGEHE